MSEDPYSDSEAEIACHVDNFQEADLLTRVLRDEGIPAAMTNDSPSAGIAGTVTMGDGLDAAWWASFAILVPAGQVDRAREIIDSWRRAKPTTEEE
ncbi:MAG: DUF2007 domain-containing protein [Acidobacteriota bacterium]|nr:DUF2007 domain-containing protein [Acidobacteriota bacterium]